MIQQYYSLAQNFSFISPTIYKSRFYKDLIQLSHENVFERNAEPELLWLKDYLTQKSTFLDIGAGTGNYIYYLDYLLFPENIYGFEPNKKLYKRLKNLFPKMNFFPFAISDKNEEGTLSFPIIDKEEMHHQGTLQPLSPENEDVRIQNQKVEIICLDNWTEKQELLKINFIKIDVVGQELSILNGAKNTLEKHKPTLMVKIEQEYYQEDIWSIIIQIENLGYDAHYLHRENFTLEKLNQEVLHKNHQTFEKTNSEYIKNIIFIRNR